MYWEELKTYTEYYLIYEPLDIVIKKFLLILNWLLQFFGYTIFVSNCYINIQQLI